MRELIQVARVVLGSHAITSTNDAPYVHLIFMK